MLAVEGVVVHPLLDPLVARTTAQQQGIIFRSRCLAVALVMMLTGEPFTRVQHRSVDPDLVREVGDVSAAATLVPLSARE